MNPEHSIVWTDAKVGRLWDYYSRTPPYSGMYFSKVFGQKILSTLNRPFFDPQKLLDFGCGPGFIWEHLTALNSTWEYTGLDFSQGSIETLQRKGAGNPMFGGAIKVESLPSPLPSCAFDIVTLIEVVEHLTDAYLDPTLTETARLLKPGGVLLITTPNNEDLSLATKFCPDCGAIFHEWQHVRSWNADTLSQRVQKFGFAAHSISAIDFGTSGFTGWLVSIAKALLKRGPRKLPHLVALFTKS